MGYVDPNAVGIVAQIGYALVFAITSILLFLFKPIKSLIAHLYRKRRDGAKPSAPSQHSAFESVGQQQNGLD